MVQLSRQDNYAKQSEARELNLYVFGFNHSDDGANDALTVRDHAELAQLRQYSNRANPEPTFTQGKRMKLAKHLNLIALKLKLTLRFETYQEMHECFEHLEKMLERFQTNEYRRARCLHDIQFWTLKMPSYFNLLTSQYQFWLYSSISEELFLKYVDTGDVILFRCRGGRQFFMMGPNITRTLTNSPFDHVAIVLRFGDYVKDLYILEAVGDKGVRIVSWMNLRHELHEEGFFEKLVTRKLLYDMTPEKLTDLDMFRRNTIGKRYGLSASKLLFNQPSQTEFDAGRSSRESALHANVDQERQFFCSELIAKAFKVLEVLKNPEKGSNNYFPGSFGFNCSIDSELKDDVALGPPLNILLNQEDDLNKLSHLQQQRQSQVPDAYQAQPMSDYFNTPEILLAEQPYNCFL